jgi:hypothetical protein
LERRPAAYTYFHDYQVGEDWEEDNRRKGRLEHLKMLRIWLRNWFANGWDPQILDISHAYSHRNFTGYLERIQAHPSRNRPEQELAGYLRWLAFCQQQGGGTFTEYDVMNLPASGVGLAKNLTTFDSSIPAVVLGDQEAMQRIVDEILNYILIDVNETQVSSWSIIRSGKERLFQSLLPDPPKLAHFNQKEKSKLFYYEIMLMDRADWINFNLELNYVRHHCVRLLKLNRAAHQCVEPIFQSIRGCHPKHVQMDALMVPALRTMANETFACKFIELDELVEEMIYDQRLDLIFFEPVVERVVRPYAESPALRTFGDNSADVMAFVLRPETQNMLVRRLVPTVEDIDKALEVAKAKLLNDSSIFIGMLSDLEASKLLLEYTVGLMLPILKQSYIPPSIQHSLPVSEELRAAILEYNWADQELYLLARSIFEGRLEEVRRIEDRLEPFWKDIPPNPYQEAMHV